MQKVFTKFFSSQTKQRHDNETDRLSLLEFKTVISLDPRQALMSWNDSTHFCSWEGVSCRLKARLVSVISLNLTDRGLVGPIPPSLGNLTFLKLLLLSRNEFTGSIPPSFGHLHRLQVLQLSNNNTLGGTIPDWLILQTRPVSWCSSWITTI